MAERFPPSDELSAEEKALVIEEFWVQYNCTSDFPPLTPELVAAIEERVAYNDAHRGQESTWEEVKSRILKLRA